MGYGRLVKLGRSGIGIASGAADCGVIFLTRLCLGEGAKQKYSANGSANQKEAPTATKSPLNKQCPLNLIEVGKDPRITSTTLSIAVKNATAKLRPKQFHTWTMAGEVTLVLRTR